MLNVSDTKIAITRGDSGYITINVLMGDDTPYILQEGDSIHIQVRDKANDGTLLFEGLIEEIEHVKEEGIEIEHVWYIRPEDTMNLNVGSYVWDAQLNLSNGDVFTFIPKSTFKITDEVTMEEGD